MKERIAQFQKQIKADAAIIENPTDLFYLTGLHLSRGLLAATKNQTVLYVDGRYFAKASKEAPCDVKLLDTEALARFLREAKAEKVEYDSAETSCDRLFSLQKEAEHVELVPRSRILKTARGIKDAEEIEALRRAAKLTWKGYQHASSLLEEGITEEEIAFEFEYYVRKHGASGLSFEPIVAFGENSAYPHYRAGKTKLQKDQIVLIDVGAVIDSYRGDLTRVHLFGTPHAELEKMLKITQAAQKAAIQTIRPGIKLEEVDRAARDVFRNEGVESLFVHGLGHGIGLETHEFPSLKTGSGEGELVLEPGIVFTVEPGLYRPGLGGVRWEDMVCVTEDGVEILTHD